MVDSIFPRSFGLFGLSVTLYNTPLLFLCYLGAWYAGSKPYDLHQCTKHHDSIVPAIKKIADTEMSAIAI